MGDGAASIAGPNNVAHIVIPFALYFVCGAAACIVPRRMPREVLAVVAHLSPLWAIFNGGAGNVIFFAVLAAILFGGFSVPWIRMFKRAPA
jgi:hypothetical protein